MIRPYRSTDRSDVERIVGALDWPEAPVEWVLYSVDRLGDDSEPSGTTLVYEGSSGVVGFVTGESQYWHEGARIFAVVVSGDHRRSGVGSALLEAFERFAQHLGASRVDIDTPLGGDKADIRAFFVNRGYQVNREFPSSMKRGPHNVNVPEVTYERSVKDR